MPDLKTLELANAWAALWNNDLSWTERIIAPDFVSHAAPLMGGPAGDSQGRDLLNTWVGGIHQVLDGLSFGIEVGPVREEDLMVVRWEARGTYRGGLPEATAQPGTPLHFFGTDTLRLDENGRIAEYWANADSLWVAQQLGLPMPPLNP